MININIFGFFVSSTIDDERGPIFRNYLYGDNNIVESLKVLHWTTYGQDLKLILFQFYVNPTVYMQQHLKVIENYRKNEKSIGIPIIVNDKNFFEKSELERIKFLKDSILQKLFLLGEVVQKKKLDIKMEMLINDLKQIF